MSNALTVSPTQSAPITWATKSGKIKEAQSPIAQALAPRGARIERANADTLAQLNAGMYRPFLRDCLALMTAKQVTAVRANVSASMATIVNGQLVAPLDPLGQPNKDTVKAFGAAISALWATSKGKKAAMLGAWVAYMAPVTDATPVTDAAPV